MKREIENRVKLERISEDLIIEMEEELSLKFEEKFYSPKNKYVLYDYRNDEYYDTDGKKLPYIKETQYKNISIDD